MSLLQNSNAISSGSYDINNSLRFRRSASAYLSRTPASATNRKTFTWSGWVKRGELGTTVGIAEDIFGIRIDGDNQFRFYFQASDVIDIYSQISGTIGARLITTAVYRDPSAWYHIVLAIDTTNATAGNRMRLYINGVEVTQFSTDTQPSLNYDTYVNTVNAHYMGYFSAASFDGYMAEVNFIDGQALTPSSFGSFNATTGVWQPAQYTGTYGTNGFYLKFSDIALTSGSNAGLGKDFSGNGNYWNTNNISVTAGTTYDAMTDVPTNTSATVANYAVMNPLTNLAGLTVSNANLNVSVGNGSSWKSVVGTMALPSTGKWYWEVTVVTGTGSTQEIVGVANTVDNISASYSGSTANTYGYQSNGSKNNNASGTSYGASYTTGDVIGVAIDLDAGTIVFYKNNTSQGTAFTGLSSSYSYVAASSLLGTTSNFATNFGQRPFAYTPPTGFVALNTFNLPTPTILQGNKYMDAVIYSGSNSNLTVTNSGSFQPDFVWGKSRSGAFNNILVDSVRGGNLYLVSNTTAADATSSGLATFTSTGITWIGGASGVNASGYTYVDWMWQAGQGSTSSNTAGSITSTVSVNTTAGFSVVTYTGTGTTGTVGHGLGVAPKMIILKARNQADSWLVYHSGLPTPATNTIILESTSAVQTSSLNWNSTNPTSSVFSVYNPGSGGYSNGNGYTYVAYCWAAIPGYSAFGSWTGNGSTDGPMIFTGFTPKFVMFKRTDTTSGWYIHDSSRNTSNVVNLRLLPNTSDAEATVTTLDFLSNGFKLRTSDVDRNASGGTYIYAAFASNPFRNSNAF